VSRYKLILNPLAGLGKAERLLPDVLTALAARGIIPDVVRTERRWHAAELAQQAITDGYDTILSMGGDGTTNEVVNGMMTHRDHQPVGTLGIIPAGSGNDFRIAIDWPDDIAGVAERIARGNRRLIDVGRINERYFVNVAGVGFDTTVTVEATKIREIAPGVLRGLPLYMMAIFKTLLLNYQAPMTTIQFDDQTIRQPTLMASVANGRRYGGGFLVAPEAQADDGLFDLLVAGYVNRPGILRLLPHFMKGTHVGKKPIYMTRARHVILEAPDPVVAQIDGEIYQNGGCRIELEVLPQSLWIIA